MPAPAEVLRLVQQFHDHKAEYLGPHYNETQLRREFIDPLFRALGWDMDNQQGYAEAYKDVIHEDAIKIGGLSKAPDYCFRIGGTRKFFLEAKKPAVNVKMDIHPAYQLRRYAWSAKLPLSILTDFEEFAVYDCRKKPFPTDKASVSRLLYVKSSEYADRWDEIASIFARDSILKGSFDKYAQAKKGKRGTAEVDSAFLEDIESWRELLAKNLAVENRKLSQQELNFAVQRIIDRIVFLRICEDRGIEDYGRLQGLLQHPRIYKQLVGLFRDADARYNSGLFHFQPEKDRTELPDELTTSLRVDDKPLKQIIEGLYYPESPYEFSVIPADILGQVYEEFLGKVIRLTAGHRAVIEPKPEVKKAGGVFYTPTFVVRFIVRETLGRVLANRTPEQADAIRILDPACGSGSFLIEAYQHLLDWYRDKYIADGPEKHRKQLHQDSTGAWKLSSAERKRILLNNIYGVDIDLQAVEVTKLSLLLKVLEGETLQSIQRELAHRALPDLGKNIKCGNSIISPDFSADLHALLESPAELARVNPFDWKAEFPAILAQPGGGFHVILGNPPYGAALSEAEKEYLQGHYVYAKGKPESYCFFLERGVQLLAPNGLLGFITPNAWLTNYYGVQIRDLMLKQTRLLDLVDLEPTKVFKKAVVDTAIVVAQKSDSIGVHEAQVWTGTVDFKVVPKFKTAQTEWLEDPDRLIGLGATPDEVNLVTKLKQSGEVLDRLVEYSQGMIPYKTEEQGEANLYIAKKRKGTGWLPLLENASQVDRYRVDRPAAFVHYGDWLWCARDPRFFSSPKILFHRLRKKLDRQLVAAYDDSGAVNRHALSNLILRDALPPTTLLAVLGLINSKLANWWFVKRYGVLMEVGGFKIAKLPLPSAWIARQEELVHMVERMQLTQQSASQAKVPSEVARLQRLMKAADEEIDRLVYALYGLTPSEIEIVERLQVE